MTDQEQLEEWYTAFCKELPKDEINKIAEELYRGIIFTSLQLSQHDQLVLHFPSVAMSPFFHDLIKMIDERKETKLGMIYGYMSNAARRAINGKPMLMNAKILNIVNTRKVMERYKEIEEFMKK